MFSCYFYLPFKMLLICWCYVLDLCRMLNWSCLTTATWAMVNNLGTNTIPHFQHFFNGGKSLNGEGDPDVVYLVILMHWKSKMSVIFPLHFPGFSVQSNPIIVGSAHHHLFWGKREDGESVCVCKASEMIKPNCQFVCCERKGPAKLEWSNKDSCSRLCI